MADKQQGSWDTLVKRNALWLQSFWFVRGIMGTMALVALIPRVTELERIEVLRALYALIIGWNEVIAFLSRLLSQIPLIPEVSPALVALMVFFLAIPLPAIVAYTRTHYWQSYPDKLSLGFIILGAVYMSALFIIFADPANTAETSEAEIDPQIRWASALVFLVMLTVSLRLAMRLVPGFRQGFLFTLGLIAAIVIGYNIGTTDFSAWVNATVCEELEIAPEDCSPAS